ncbi:protein TIFY 10A-like [Diospyros lotus]|uniref:protein TIFY 10A-like n=1 Tax=Diospyros lotus TaxID=55363 RepID=UPI00224FE87E|nr:protein TIFY 10A-like [Diospyros lotus]
MLTSLDHPARAPEKSLRFSQTCSLLSQYLKENGSLGDLSLGIPGAFRQTATTPPTMNLFPVAKQTVEVPGAAAPNEATMDLFPQHSGFIPRKRLPKKVDSVSSVNKSSKSEPETAQMTIFYAGQVVVIDDLPADKAKEVVLLARRASSHNLGALASTSVQKPIETSSNVVANLGADINQDHGQGTPQSIATDLPIARKASLTRFLEKRKDRITSRAPYQTSKASSPPKPAESKWWLGLAAQSPEQLERTL